MSGEITLHRDDLEQILKIVDQLNPAGNKLSSGLVTIIESASTGIGSIVSIEIDTNLNGLDGKFVKEIIGAERW